MTDLRHRAAVSEQHSVTPSLEMSTLRTEAQQATEQAGTTEAACLRAEELLKVAQDERLPFSRAPSRGPPRLPTPFNKYQLWRRP